MFDNRIYGLAGFLLDKSQIVYNNGYNDRYQDA